MSKPLPKLIGKTTNFISYFSSRYAAHLAIKLFSSPQKGKISQEESQYLDSAIKNIVTHDDIALMTYHWKGKKDTILLVHGWESNSFRWKDLIELLRQEDYNIISVDAPAHGGSGSKIFNAPLYSECINTIIKHFRVGIIVGHSVGATASAIALHNYNIPSAKKLISLGAPSNFNNTINSYINMMGYNHKVVKAMNKNFMKHFGYLPEYLTISNFSQNIKAETLIIHDKKDRIISYRDALDIK